MRKLKLLLILIFAFTLISQVNAQKTVKPNIVKTPTGFAISKPLKENPIVSKVVLENEEFYMNKHRDRKLDPNIVPPDFSKMPVDPNVQTKPGWINNTAKALNLNFAGQNSGSYPPDCNGTVGPSHYFQVVNTTYAIYDKSGTLVAGPSALNSIFNSSLPGAGENDGDPIVLWDEHANRWFYAEFSLSNQNDYMLIAVSTTADPTGTWYSWSYDVADTPDYMKFGIWEDGYYMATNTSNGNDVYVFERDAMIAGDPNAQMIGFDNPNRPSTFDGFHCIIPLDNDGPWAPTGTPGQFITIADDGQSNPSDALYIYELNADWNTPSNSTFVRTQSINVNAFSGNFNGSWDNIPQPGTTRKLDGISTVLMYRAQYRNFNGTQKIVCTHTIAESSTEAAIRWYELENTGSSWSIVQQGTYNPDNVSRWNASIAMNALGQIGMGYSVGNTSVYPGIRYCGQTDGAPSGVMDIAETVIWDGSYSQTAANRWGDYSNISIDPSDGETFWFTSEYMGSSTHGTRVAAFTFGTSSNIAPTANANGPYSGEAGTAISFSSAGSTDSDGTIVSYSWNFGDGGTSTLANPTHTYSSSGTYTATLTVTDDGGKTGSDNASVTVAAGPGSYASVPYSTGFEGGFDGNWTTQGSNSFSRIQITTANTPHSGSNHLTMDVTTNGNYCTNEAWMGLDLSGLSQVDLNFWWKDFSDETHAEDGVYFSDDGGATFVKIQDLNGASYTNNVWSEFNLDLDQLASANGLSLTSTFVVKFQQYDNYAITTDGMAFDDISVTSGAANVAPTANANGPYSGTEGVAIAFSSAGSSDSDGTIVSYSWNFGDGGSSTSANPTYTYATAGTYTATLTVTDNGGLTGTDNASVTVNVAANVAPTANANGPYSGTEGVAVSFSSAGSSDSDGTITGYLWDFGDGGTSTSANPSYTYAAAGTYTATLTVTDNGGLTGSDNASVTINPAGGGGDYALLPYSTGFESGFDANWSTQGSNSYSRIQITSANTPHGGSNHLTMDVTTNGNYCTNEAWMGLNLSGQDQVDLSFWWKDFSDETHSTDGVYFSDDGGATFVKVQDLNGASYTNNVWSEFNLDVDQLASANGLTLSGTFVVKFQQYDNYVITTDGMAFDDISVTVGTVTVDPPTGYCASQGSNSSYEWIDLVQLGTINNASGNDGGYADYTSMSTDLIFGNQYTINFSCGFSSTAYTEFWHVFIDYNRDGDFTDAGEEVVTGSSSSDATLSGTFTVPGTASTGFTRMRVSMKWDAAATPCETFSYGEVEDYLVYLTPVARSKETVSYETGFEIGNEDNLYTLYPNPSSDVINIKMPMNSKLDIKITNIDGKEVKRANLTQNRSINISELPAGIYLVNINDGRKTTIQRFVKY